MSLAPLFNAPPVFQAHAFAALAAIVLAAAQFAGPKGTRIHRALGWTWATLMMAVAVSSLFIHTIWIWGPWSPIHLLSLLTIVTVPLAVYAAHRHEVRRHRLAMSAITVFALIVAGLFTLAPGRIMHDVVFGR